MSTEVNPRRPRRGTYRPRPETLALLKTSGNVINGLGESKPRQASPFFWHPPTQHPYGELQNVARQSSRKCPGSAAGFMAAYNHPALEPIAVNRTQAPAQALTDAATAFALSHEVDAVGIAAMDPLYVFEGIALKNPGSSCWCLRMTMSNSGRCRRTRATAQV